jgi:hypothetical protein
MSKFTESILEEAVLEYLVSIGWQVQMAQLRLNQEETRKELNAMMPSILDKAFKNKL